MCVFFSRVCLEHHTQIITSTPTIALSSFTFAIVVDWPVVVRNDLFHVPTTGRLNHTEIKFNLHIISVANESTENCFKRLEMAATKIVAIIFGMAALCLTPPNDSNQFKIGFSHFASRKTTESLCGGKNASICVALIFVVCAADFFYCLIMMLHFIMCVADFFVGNPFCDWTRWHWTLDMSLWNAIIRFFSAASTVLRAKTAIC